MYKSMTLLVLVALAAACVLANDLPQQDQEAAEQYYHIHGVYPSWYTYGATTFNGVRTFPYTGYPFAGYPYTGYPAAASVAGVKNVAYPYATYPYGYNTYPYAGAYGAVPYVAAAPAAADAAPAKTA